MGEKDIAEKILEDYPDVFADIVYSFRRNDPARAGAVDASQRDGAR